MASIESECDAPIAIGVGQYLPIGRFASTSVFNSQYIVTVLPQENDYANINVFIGVQTSHERSGLGIFTNRSRNF